VLVVGPATHIVVTDRGRPRVLTQVVIGQELVPLGLDVGLLDLVAAGDQQFGIGVDAQGVVEGLGPTQAVGHLVAGGSDLRVPEEQEVVVTLEALRPEGVGR